MTKIKVTDEQIIELIKAKPAMSNRAMALKLGMSISGPTNARIGRLKKEMLESGDRFDVQLYDTITKGADWYRVIKLDKDSFTVKRTDNYGDAITVSKADYMSGKTGFKKRDLPPVKTYQVKPDSKIAAGDVRINGQPIKNLPDSVKGKIVDKLREDMGPMNPDNAPEAADNDNDARYVPTVESLFVEAVADDYIDPEWGVAAENSNDANIGNADKATETNEKAANAARVRREYLDKIDQLLDAALPCCTDKDVAYKVGDLAERILELGITAEIAELLEVRND
ncbi:MAG: winged helix-turn-helix domain-containing protein [Eubacteriales bacterium]|nr:winged helix-turn-helix domain-containing protein [Eubacteriales bacterium]